MVVLVTGHGDRCPDTSLALAVASLRWLLCCLPEEHLCGQSRGPDLGGVPDYRRAWENPTPMPIPTAVTLGPWRRGPDS